MIEHRKRKGGRKAYLVRVEPFKAQTVYSREAATTLEIDLKNRKALGHLYQAPPTTLGDELDSHLGRRETTRGNAERTLEFNQQTAKGWKPLRGLLVSQLTRQIIEDRFHERAKTAPVAANNELKLIKSCLREAASRRQQVDPAIFEIPPVKHRPRRGRALEVEQVFELGSWFPEYVRRLIPLAGLVGARQSFWFALTDDLLDLDGGRMVAPAELQKNTRDHPVYLTDVEIALFREQLLARPNGTRLVFPTKTGLPFTRHYFRKIWVKGVEAAARGERVAVLAADGVSIDDVSDDALAAIPSVFDGFTFHWLRHTAGSLMAVAGMDPASAAERLGHSDGGALFLTTYRHLYEGERRRQAERFGAFVAGELERDEAKEAAQ